MGCECRCRLFRVGTRQDYRAAVGLCEQVTDYGDALFHGLPRPVNSLGKALAQRPVVVNPRKAEVGIGQPPEPAHHVIGADRPRLEVTEQTVERGFVHVFPCCHAFDGWLPVGERDRAGSTVGALGG